MKKIGLVLVAGGSGKRMGSEIPKQFIPIHGKPILQHTIDRFSSWNKEIQIVVVLPEEQIEYWESCAGKKESLPYTICAGGSERFYSVKKGLEKLRDVELVFIHDGVRPCVSHDTLDHCYSALENHSGVIPVLPANESLRKIEGSSSKALNRSEICIVQTPQCFDYQKIMKAYSHEFDPFFTDDASVFERDGNPVFLVDGNKENIKITQTLDLELARHLLA
jgi:2-C-methyl-D-erythritol 4-phosphate cytidylyltransferase